MDKAEIKRRATEILHTLYGPDAVFRNGQYEAIEATLTNKRTLVVQKTGWGKSLVYFICTKLLREDGKGLTLVISPLLVLMQNQTNAAAGLSLRCESFNSETKELHDEILTEAKTDELDLLFITPESLFGEDFQNVVGMLSIGMFVIDEAHCISDWGHDFRLKYANLYQFVKGLPFNVPLLATTATANDRVIEDLEAQLAGDAEDNEYKVFVLRGPLTRETLAIEIVKLESKAERYAWILENIEKLPGSGIIYCLTKRDCDYLTDFLRSNGVSAMPYYSEGSKKEQNTIAERAFMNNEIKAIVATIKLGMGYDKPDIGFVIHFQQPGNVVAYYQQIGRAGRAIKKAYAFLMTGKEDDEILNYFINTAFPNKQNQESVMEALRENNGLTRNQLLHRVNLRGNVLDKGLAFLEHERFIYRDDGKYFLTGKPFVYNGEHYERVLKTRREEKELLKAFTRTKECYSRYIVGCLNDDTAGNCGICSNCMERDVLESLEHPTFETITRVQEHLNGLMLPIESRKRWPSVEYFKTIVIQSPNAEGIALAKYGDAGYGALVKEDKYSGQGFRDELAGRSAEVLRPIVRGKGIEAITCVPSLRTNIVPEFAKRLAENLKIHFVDLLGKKDAPPQKRMENSPYQCENALKSFFLIDGAHVPKSVILVDDVIDSRWTMTVCGHLLSEAGCELVFPFALADSSNESGVEGFS
jgi:ATP-dependent DNA helicase RecQ